jgi:hypothetical protein
MSRLAAARTIPVTNNAIQENSRKSLTTLPMIAPVLRQTAVACPDPKRIYRDQNVAAPARIDDYGGRCGDGATLMAHRNAARGLANHARLPPAGTVIASLSDDR